MRCASEGLREQWAVQGGGEYQRAEGAKFRRAVVDVDAKGQRGIWFVDASEIGEGEKKSGKKGEGKGNTCMGITIISSHALAHHRRHFGSLHCTSANETSLWKMVRCSSSFAANICPALENPEPLQVLLDATLKTATPPTIACLNTPQHLEYPNHYHSLGSTLCARNLISRCCSGLVLGVYLRNIVYTDDVHFDVRLQATCTQALRVLIRHR